MRANRTFMNAALYMFKLRKTLSWLLKHVKPPGRVIHLK